VEAGNTVVIEIPYAPRPAFLPFHTRSARWSVIVAHRRAGKTVACVNELIKAAIASDKKDGRYAYIAPQFNQAKDIAWLYLQRYAGVIPGASFNESELRVDLPNGARIRLYGADNPDRLRGIYLDGVILDEYADMRPSVWGEVIRPLLADRQGWAVFIGTPKGHNAFHDIWEKADESWYRLKLKASETGLIHPDELAGARSQMTEDQYQQEFECSFEAAIMGAYYGKEMRGAEDDGRITRVPYEPGSEVITAWDLGIGDSTAIWFAQVVGREPRLVDYYEASGAGLDHYMRVLKERPYNYGTFLLPHDAEVTELGTGLSRVEVMKSLGMRQYKVVPKLPVDDGIQAARLFLRKCVFDAVKCKQGIEALKQYRTEYDEKAKAFKQRPLHDWTSHAADAFRYLALGIGYATPQAQKFQPIKYANQGIV
jgi:phage terminase large subunit